MHAKSKKLPNKFLFGGITLVILIFLSIGLFFIFRSGMAINNFDDFEKLVSSDFKSYNHVQAIFPKSPEHAKKYREFSIELMDRDLSKLLAVPASERNFENTIRAFDDICKRFSIILTAMQSFEMVCPDESLVKACTENSVALKQYYVDAVSCNKKIRDAVNEYSTGNAKNERLDSEQKYYLQELIKGFARQGLDLPEDKLEKVRTLKKELAELSSTFELNVSKDKSFILVDESELAGLESDFIAQLKRDEHGKIKLTCDYPTYFNVMEYCKSERVRKDLYRAFNNRAYPHNIECLNNIILKRDKLARKIGFTNYAALDIDSEMAGRVERAEGFLSGLYEKSIKKAHQEKDEFLSHLPDSVCASPSGCLNPWDLPYIKSCYKKKHFDIDERKIAEYFPVDHALNAMFQIYQNFLGLRFDISKPAWAWHEDVKLIKIYDAQTDVLRGYLFLDLYPRENKYSHACINPIIPTTIDEQGSIHPSVDMMIANFPQATADKPALFKFSDVETFFHEFGHAMHSVLGATKLAGCAGTSVKTDFVEVPSQMFEEWLYEKDVLRLVSKHYKTGQPLPDQMIEKLVALKKFDSGLFVSRQCWLSSISLEFFKDGKYKDTDLIIKTLSEKMVNFVNFDEQTHFQASFGHLTGYGAKYYSYMWSKVFSLDLFCEIKRRGLMDPAVGHDFVEKVLGRGGSADPNELLKDFLGREPNEQAFLHDLGMI